MVEDGWMVFIKQITFYLSLLIIHSTKCELAFVLTEEQTVNTKALMNAKKVIKRLHQQFKIIPVHVNDSCVRPIVTMMLL